jgi:hypothetical protein
MKPQVRLLSFVSAVGTSAVLAFGSHATGVAGSEVARIQTQLARVVRQLEHGDVSRLSFDQRRNRAGHIEVLRRYLKVGRFPHNHEFASTVPYFVDRHGTLCALGYLIAESGRRDLLDQFVAANNNASVSELMADPRLGPALTVWLHEAGLTIQEAARIQPAYVCRGADGREIPCPPGSYVDLHAGDFGGRVYRLTSGYALASAAVDVTSAVSVVLNTRRSGAHDAAWTGLLGVASGTLGIILGASHFDEHEWPLAFGITDAAVGATSAVYGVRRLLMRHNTHELANARVQAPVEPRLSFDARGNPRFGLRVRF